MTLRLCRIALNIGAIFLSLLLISAELIFGMPGHAL